MGQVFVDIKLSHPAGGRPAFTCRALVDTGTTFLTLPESWRERFGELEITRRTTAHLADNREAHAKVGAAIRVEIEGFEPIYAEPLFLDIQPDRATGTALLGCVPLESAAAAIDPIGHRLVPLNYVFAK